MNEFPPNTTTWKVELIPIFTDNYIFLITNNSNTRAVVVDPGEAESIQKILVEKKLVLTEILLTHHHQDHIGGVDTLKEQYPAAKIYAPLKNKAEIPGADFYVVHGPIGARRKTGYFRGMFFLDWVADDYLKARFLKCLIR